MNLTYIRLACGFAYLMAIIDGYSRRVLAGGLPSHLDRAVLKRRVEYLAGSRQARRPGPASISA